MNVQYIYIVRQPPTQKRFSVYIMTYVTHLCNFSPVNTNIFNILSELACIKEPRITLKCLLPWWWWISDVLVMDYQRSGGFNLSQLLKSVPTFVKTPCDSHRDIWLLLLDPWKLWPAGCANLKVKAGFIFWATIPSWYIKPKWKTGQLTKYPNENNL